MRFEEVNADLPGAGLCVAHALSAMLLRATSRSSPVTLNEPLSLAFVQARHTACGKRNNLLEFIFDLLVAANVAKAGIGNLYLV